MSVSTRSPAGSSSTRGSGASMLSRVPRGKHCPQLPDAHRRDTHRYQLRAALGWARWVRDHDRGPVLPLRAQQASRRGTSKVTRSGSPLQALAVACRCHPSPALNLATHLSVTCRPTCGMHTPKQVLQAPQNQVPPGVTVLADGTASTQPPGSQPPTHLLTQQAIIKY